MCKTDANLSAVASKVIGGNAGNNMSSQGHIGLSISGNHNQSGSIGSAVLQEVDGSSNSSNSPGLVAQMDDKLLPFSIKSDDVLIDDDDAMFITLPSHDDGIHLGSFSNISLKGYEGSSSLPFPSLPPGDQFMDQITLLEASELFNSIDDHHIDDSSIQMADVFRRQ